MEQKIEEWNQKREQLKRLEKECDKYRNAIIKYMNTNEVDSIKTSKFRVSRKNITREVISKKKMPKDLWDRYSTITSYDKLSVTRNRK